MKPCYKQALCDIVQKIKSTDASFCFAVVADSHLDNSVGDTCDNLRALGAETELDCVLHLGDIMCGGFGRRTIKKLMRDEIDLFRSASPNGHFYPARGNHDGFNNLVAGGSDIRLDEDWYDATSYVDTLPNVSRPYGMPYFYVDYPQSKVRLIALNSFFYREVDGDRVKGGVNGYDDVQLEWFKTQALNAPEGWTLITFAHDAPVKNFDDTYDKDNPIYNGNEMLEAIRAARREKGIDFAAWLVGHYHGDMEFCAGDINLVLVASQTAYVPALWDMPEGGCYHERKPGTDTEDLWDAVCLDKAARTLRFCRFGAGADREILY